MNKSQQPVDPCQTSIPEQSAGAYISPVSDDLSHLDVKLLFNVALLAGEILLSSGAEIYRV